MPTTAIPASRAGRRWRVLLILFLIRTAMGYQFQVVGSLGGTLVDAYAMDYAQLGTLVGLYLTPGIAMAIPSGLLGRWLGDQRIMLIALALMIAGAVAAGYATTFPMAAIGRLTAGVGAVLLNVLLAKLVIDWFADRELALGMAILVNSWPLGIGIGLIVQPMLLETIGLEAAKLSTALILVLAFLLALANDYEVPTTGDGGQLEPAGSLTRSEYVGAFVAGSIWGCFNAAILTVMSFAPAMLLAQGQTLTGAGRLVSVATWLGIVGVIAGGWLAHRVPRSKVIMFAGFGAGAIAIAMMPHMELRPVGFVLFGLIGFMPAGLIMALPAAVLRPEARSLGMGIYYTVFYGAVSVFPALAGLARDFSGDPSAPIWLAAFLMAICIVIARLFDRLPQRPPSLRSA